MHSNPLGKTTRRVSPNLLQQAVNACVLKKGYYQLKPSGQADSNSLALAVSLTVLKPTSSSLKRLFIVKLRLFSLSTAQLLSQPSLRNPRSYPLEIQLNLDFTNLCSPHSLPRPLPPNPEKSK